MFKIGNIYRWLYGHITGKTNNFNWLVEGKLAGSAVPTSLREIRWLDLHHGIRSIVTIREKPLPARWFENVKIEYFYLDVRDYGAPSLEKLDYVVNYITREINRGKPVMVHCCGGKGRTGTILAGYLMKQKDGIDARRAIYRLRSVRGEVIESKEQMTILYRYESYLKNQGLP